MAAVTAQQPTAPSADELDEIFNYDLNVDDVFRDVDTNMRAPPRANNDTQPGNQTNGDVLGIDEQIKVAKKRAPIPKLDEARYVIRYLKHHSHNLLRARQAPLSSRYSQAKAQRQGEAQIQGKRS